MELMLNDTNPVCTSRQAPYAHEILQNLDLTGIFLFTILTLMTLVANLVFVEEVHYIYKKIPSSKRSLFVWVNAAAPVIASTSCIGMWIPRASMFTDFTAAVFCAIVIHKFLMMMIKECGGQNLFLRRFENERFKISTGPCCCCCLCLPYPKVTRRNLLVLKLGTFQFAFLRPVLMFISIVLWTNGTYDLSNLSANGAAIWINCFTGAITIIALWPVGIMFNHVRVLLNFKKIIPKFALYQIKSSGRGVSLRTDEDHTAAGLEGLCVLKRFAGDKVLMRNFTRKWHKPRFSGLFIVEDITPSAVKVLGNRASIHLGDVKIYAEEADEPPTHSEASQGEEVQHVQTRSMTRKKDEKTVQ